MIQEWHASRGTSVSDPSNGCYVKDMHQIRAIANVPLHTPVVALDDHPENIVNGHVRSVGCGAGYQTEVMGGTWSRLWSLRIAFDGVCVFLFDRPCC